MVFWIIPTGTIGLKTANGTCSQWWDYWFEFVLGQEWLNVIVIILSLGNMDVKGKVSAQGVVQALPFGWLWVTGTHQSVQSKRSPQGTWYCCLPTCGHCSERLSTNPVETHLLCCFWHLAKQGMWQELVGNGPQLWYCPCSSSVVLAEVLKLPGFQSCPRQKFRNWLESYQKNPRASDMSCKKWISVLN